MRITGLHREAELGHVDLGVVAGEHPLLLEAPDPLGDRRRAQGYPPPELGEGEPGVSLEEFQELPVLGVESIL